MVSLTQEWTFSQRREIGCKDDVRWIVCTDVQRVVWSIELVLDILDTLSFLYQSTIHWFLGKPIIWVQRGTQCEKNSLRRDCQGNIHQDVKVQNQDCCNGSFAALFIWDKEYCNYSASKIFFICLHMNRSLSRLVAFKWHNLTAIPLAKLAQFVPFSRRNFERQDTARGYKARHPLPFPIFNQ